MYDIILNKNKINKNIRVTDIIPIFNIYNLLLYYIYMYYYIYCMIKHYSHRW